MKIFNCVIIFLMVISMYDAQADENFVTVYNKNLALIKQIRNVELNQESPILKFADVAAQIIPSSVHLCSLNENSNFQVIEQNFEYDLVSSEKILEKYINYPIEIIRENGELIKGTLLSKSEKSLVLNCEEGIKIIPWNDKMSINVKQLPDGLITKPTLIWELDGIKTGNEKIEVSYLSEGLSWHAEYVGVLNEDESNLNLAAWISLNNRCGTTFDNAKLKLVAGDVNRASTSNSRGRLRTTRAKTQFATAGSQFKAKSFFEYHIYELERVTTLKNNQIKQIALFSPVDINCEKKFYYNFSQSSKKIQVRLNFKNDKASGLGRPLPAGIFRIFKSIELEKSGKSMEFVGEDRIDHTAKSEELKIKLGNAFDLTGERKVITKTKLSQTATRQTVEIELRNNKSKEDVNIIVEENLFSIGWKVESSNFKYLKKDSHNIEFIIPVKAGEKTVLQYTVLFF